MNKSNNRNIISLDSSAGATDSPHLANKSSSKDLNIDGNVELSVATGACVCIPIRIVPTNPSVAADSNNSNEVSGNAVGASLPPAEQIFSFLDLKNVYMSDASSPPCKDRKIPKPTANSNGSVVPCATGSESASSSGTTAAEERNPKQDDAIKSIANAAMATIPTSSPVDLHDLQATRGGGFCIAVVLHSLFFGLLALNFAWDYINQLDEQFLSPSTSAGVCTEVPIAVEGSFYADANGLWESDPMYTMSKSIYILKMSGTEMTLQEYSERMTEIRALLEASSSKAAQRDVGYTMVALSSIVARDSDSTLRLFMNAEADDVFGHSVYDVWIGSKDYRCFSHGPSLSGSSGVDSNSPSANSTAYSFPQGTYNEASKTIDVLLYANMDSEYGLASTCPMIDIDDFLSSYKQLDSEGLVRMQFDVRSISTAVAVNYGMLSVTEDLVRISHPDSDHLYIDSYYSDMDPIYCITGEESSTDVCVLLSNNNAWLYPVITQRNGNNTDMCVCDGISDATIDVKDDPCSDMDVHIAFIYFPATYNANVTSAWNAFISTAMQYRSNDLINGDLMLPTAVHSLQNGLNEHNAMDLFNDFCGGNCTIISMSIWGGGYFKSINKFGVQMGVLYKSGNIHSCQETLYKREAFDVLSTKPPTKLIESFYVCRITRATALQRAFGNAAGTADVFSMVVLSALFTLLVRIYNRWFSGDTPLVDSDEKKVIVESVLLHLHKENKALKDSLAALELQLKKQQAAMDVLLLRGGCISPHLDVSQHVTPPDIVLSQLTKEVSVDETGASLPSLQRQEDLANDNGYNDGMISGSYQDRDHDDLDEHALYEDDEEEELVGDALYGIISDEDDGVTASTENIDKEDAAITNTRTSIDASE